MALKVTPTLAENVKVGDFISRRNVLKNRVELYRITLIRNSGDTFAFNYADAHTGQQVDYIRISRGDSINIITSE
jgi:hypothetical protein